MLQGEMERRRKIQIEFNAENNVTPTTIKKAIKDGIESYKKAKELNQDVTGEFDDEYELRNVLNSLEEDMKEAARNLQFEKAIAYREQIKKINRKLKHK